ncbi:zinc-ribbon-domain-containing protein [Cladochytrium replicatum]|nr:zinc-ribbon-domain-containing protein [Cladochytrium replicatum]
MSHFSHTYHSGAGGVLTSENRAHTGLSISSRTESAFEDMMDHDMEDHEDDEDEVDHEHGSSSDIGSDEDEDMDGQEKDSQDKDQRLQEAQAELRKRIMVIQSDRNLSAELMTSSWQTKQKTTNSRSALASNKLEHKRSDFNMVTEQDKLKTYHDKDSLILGCKHYQRACKLQAHCCGRWYTCRFCHDEVSDHSIIRNLTTTMMCMYCSTVQPSGHDCINPDCKRRVAKYYCKECKLWDDDPRKNIYHCYDCGICRIGKGLGQDYFHCKKCNVCMAISLKGRHKCIERNLESDCPICGEYMFTSTTTVIFMPCGHCIHYKCHQEYIQTSYQCPTCFKSLANMTEYFKRIDAMLGQHQMPPEYANTQSYIYCNDCEKKSHAKFHFLYHKCGHCSGYNSKVLHTVEVHPDQGGQSESGKPPAAAVGAGIPASATPVSNHASATTTSIHTITHPSRQHQRPASAPTSAQQHQQQHQQQTTQHQPHFHYQPQIASHSVHQYHNHNYGGSSSSSSFSTPGTLTPAIVSQGSLHSLPERSGSFHFHGSNASAGGQPITTRGRTLSQSSAGSTSVSSATGSTSSSSLY